MSHCPWTYRAISISGNSMIPCCRFQENITIQDDINYEFKHGDFVSVRQRLDAGEKIPECNQCWKDEESGIQSLRQQGLDMWGTITEPEIKYVEFDLDNTCNLKCVSCGVNNSSAWLEDEKKIFETDDLYFREITDHYTQIDLSKLETIKLFGGEPLISKRIHNLCKNILLLNNLNYITVYMNTNATVLPKLEVEQVLLNCKNLNLSISIDGIGDLHDFVRHGVAWTELEKNFEYFDSLFDRRKNKTTVINIHTTAHIYNINFIHTIRDYFKKNYPRFTSDVELLFKPKYISVLNSPQEYKNTIIDYLQTHGFSELTLYLKKEELDMFDYFISVHKKLIELRKIDFSKLNPKLDSYIRNYPVREIDKKRLINLRLGIE